MSVPARRLERTVVSAAVFPLDDSQPIGVHRARKPKASMMFMWNQHRSVVGAIVRKTNVGVMAKLGIRYVCLVTFLRCFVGFFVFVQTCSHTWTYCPSSRGARFPVFSPSETLHSDQGTEFENTFVNCNPHLGSRRLVLQRVGPKAILFWSVFTARCTTCSPCIQVPSLTTGLLPFVQLAHKTVTSKR